MCVCERERERERDCRVCVCVCVWCRGGRDYRCVCARACVVEGEAKNFSKVVSKVSKIVSKVG